MLRRYDYFSSNSSSVEILYSYRKRSMYIRLLTLPLYLYERITFYRLYYWNFTFPLESKLFMMTFKVYRYFKELRIPIKSTTHSGAILRPRSGVDRAPISEPERDASEPVNENETLPVPMLNSLQNILNKRRKKWKRPAK